MGKKGLMHYFLLITRITFIAFMTLFLSGCFILLCMRIYNNIYNRNIIGVSLKNSLETLEQVKNAEVDVSFFWFDGHLDFNVKLELLSGDTLFLEYVHKDMVFCEHFGSLKSINDLSFYYSRIPITSSQGLPLDLLQVYMNEDLSTVSLFLNKYSEIKESVMKLPSVHVFHNDGGKVVFDEIDPMGQDSEGHYFELFKKVEIY